MEKTVIIPAIVGDPKVLFLGTDEEIDTYEKQEDACKEAWRVLVENSIAFEFQRGLDHIIFSECPDNDGKFRLSFFWNGESRGRFYDDIPVMHENYQANYEGNCENLFSRLAGYCHNREIVVTAI